MSSSSPIAPSICHNLADTLLKQLRSHPFALYPQMNHDLVAGNPVARAPEPLAAAFGPKSKASDPIDREPEPLAPAFGPKSKTGDPVDRSAKTTRYYMVLLTAGDKALSPESIRVMDVTDPIPKGCMVKARAFCSGVAFNFNFSAADMKLCVISNDDEFGSDEGRTMIDLDRVSNSEMPDPNIMHSLASSAATKALVSSAKEINLAEFVGRVGEYVATKFGEEKKSEYLKMLTSSGLGSLDSVEIWHMLTLQDLMEAVMESFRVGLFMKMPITIDMPMPSTASMTHPTPRALGWKVGCSSAKGLKPRPCIPDLNQVAVDLLEEEEETDKSSVGEVEGRNAKKRKAEEAAGEEAQADEVPKTAD